ncbi:M23 family metallopeptidase [Mesorhizobium sp. CAU 1732]|uniref:M23 family metallopeptidase n=1 Tax=Mesorhizobium sp. CAU 1732 TaxID=3140358 RepID=UPI003260B1F8
MQPIDDTIAALGNEPPLVGDGRSGPPDRREVSARWLSGTFLTGITSSVLMGVALFAALDGREMLATPPELLKLSTLDSSDGGDASKTGRLVAPRTLNRATDRRRMELSTMTKAGDREVVRTLPFIQVKMALAAGHTTNRNYPAFDPLEVFSEDGAAQTANTGVIYGAKVDSEVSLRTIDFPIETATFDERSALTAEEVETVVRNTGAILTDGDVQVAALHYVDPQRFGDTLATQTLSASYGIRIVPENVSVSARETSLVPEIEYAEDIIPFPADREIAEALDEAGYSGDDSDGMAESFAKLLNGSVLKAGHVLRLGIETRNEVSRIVRGSVYEGRNHIRTIALDDHDQYVPGSEPEPNPAVLTAFDENQPVVRTRGDLPTVYDGIYRAAYSYGLSRTMTQQLVRLLASDVDFQSRLTPTDQLDVFFSQPDDDDTATEESELLYVQASFGGTMRTFYRFQMEDGGIDYFDEEGRSARQFLLRNPVPNGTFRSGFGGRRHPILGYTRMHTGVDWSAPRGTPIIAAGNGVVEKAGWAGGYGRQTIIRHANGYKTSYNHQNAIARGVTEGAEVRQGQVIGYVGTTGLSTGPHLHYELMVNGTKVDPMRVRLPGGRVLKGDELEVFLEERKRIDTLLEEQDAPSLRMASARVEN